jgi:hypothetical protein
MSLATECGDGLSLEALLKMLIRDGDCDPFVDCDNKDESIDSLYKRLFSVLEDGTLALNVCDCEAQ